MSRQTKWQHKMKEQGRCVICGKKAVEGMTRCEYHQRADKINQKRNWNKKKLN